MCDKKVCDILASWGFADAIVDFNYEGIDHTKFIAIECSFDDRLVEKLIPDEERRETFIEKLSLYQGLHFDTIPIEIEHDDLLMDQKNLYVSENNGQSVSKRSLEDGELIEGCKQARLDNSQVVRESTESTGSNDNENLTNILLNLDALDLEQLIKKTNVGQWILSKYRNKVLPGDARATIVDIVIRSLVEIPIASSDGKITVPQLKTHHFEILTRKFCSIFEKEDPRTYFILPKTDGKNQTTAKGKFIDKYRNWRTTQKKLGLIAQKKQDDSDEEDRENIAENKDKTPNEHILWLKNNDSPWRSVIQHWRLSAEDRLPQFRRQQGNVQEIFKEYLVLKQPSGHELIDIDFTYEKGREGVFYAQWPNLSKKLYELMQKEIKDTASKQLLETLSSDGISDGEKNLKLLLLLPALCPPVCRIKKPGSKSVWKPSIEDSQTSFILHVKIAGDIDRTVREIREKYRQFGIKLQPFIIVVGPTLSEIAGYYVNIDDTRYRFGSILAAVDLCFKTFHVLHAEYPKPSEQDGHAFKRHLDRKHKIKEDNENSESIPSTSSMNTQTQSFPLISAERNLIFSNQDEYNKSFGNAITELNDLIRNSAGLFVAKVHNQTAIPRNVVQNCINFTKELFECGIFDVLQTKVFSVCGKKEFTTMDKNDLQTMFNFIKDPFQDLDSEYKRKEYFKKTGFFIEPESYIIGEGKTYKLINGIKTEDTILVKGQFISVKKVLNVFLSLPNFLQIILNYMDFLSNKIDTQYMCNIIHGKLWLKIKEKFGDKIAIPLIIYFDEFEPNNVIGSHSGIDKIGATYLMLPTIPPQFQSTLKNIFLTLFFNENDRKSFGNRAVFRPLLKELKDLEINGLMINNLKIYFSCILITGDNLGLHQICGFVESFSANFVCRFCTISKEELRCQTIEDSTLRRKSIDYENDLEKNDLSKTGLTEYCIWNDLPSYHVLENGFCDVMHDFWEGVCLYDLSQILLHFIQRLHISIEDINDRIIAFNYGPIDQGNAVPCLKKEKLMHNKLGFSASETMTFVKYLGLIIGDLVPMNDSYWKLYLYLRGIGEIFNLRFLNKDCIVLLKTLVSEHHELYIELFGNTLKPKHHFLLHYPMLFDLIGPVRNVWCMRAEAKHKQSKVTAHISNSRVNLPYTLALKHQYQQCYSFMCKDSLLDKIQYGHAEELIDQRLDNIHHLFPLDFYVNNTVVHSVSWVNIENIQYKPSMIITIGYEDHMPIFGAIVEILLNSEKKCAFIFKKIYTLGWVDHVCAFEVILTNKLTSICHDMLFSKFPTSVHHSGDGNYYVIYNDP